MMLESQIIKMVLGAGVFLFILTNLSKLKQYPFINILIAGFGFHLLGGSSTLLEGFVPQGTLNVIQQCCHVGSALCVFIWVGKSLANGEEVR
ncbi:hypothetical protein [Desulfosarcina ovata]|uniref:Uncharacterized protein n=1 Tax=Desulfosarcina ovata subsp. sediminis TaxID=885957 RepID=A0A5K7ZX89_9BACT|nr:hypothetical protein [Desulfosarcina ovata]BBO84786.1 hypothetical protein DSCO28_53520 [Desulfosarcina ovata subsp. sediminis]